MRTPLPTPKIGRQLKAYWCLLFLLLSFFVSVGAMAQTVTSDKDDYAPGEIAHITGTGWTQDQMVHVEFKEEPDYPDYHSYDIGVNSDGTWQIDYAIEERHLGVKFIVTAVGRQSGAKATWVFTDGFKTNLAVESSAGVYNGSITLKATLTQSSGQGNGSLVASKPISFSLNNTFVGSTNTTSAGVAMITVNLPSTIPSATYSNGITASFVGDNIYDSSSGANQLTVNKATVTVSNITANNREYNATSTATLNTSNATLSGVVSGETVTLNTSGATASFATKVVGTNKPVTVSGLGLSGTTASNYTLTQPTGLTATITAKGITITGVTASNKVYDGNSTATLNTGSAALSGVFSGDAVNFSSAGAQGAFNDGNIGTGKAVTVSGFAISNTDAGNYSLSQPTGLSANITAKSLTPVVTVSNKVYDAGTTATILTRSVTGKVGSEDVTLTGGTAAFADKVVANGKTVTVTGLGLTGAAAGNYSLASATTTATANITTATLTPSFTTTATREYDATTAAAIVERNLAGVLSTDAVNITGGTASFADKNVGTGKTVTASGFSLTGADATNYVLSATSPTTTAGITAKPLTVAGLAASSKAYDGTAAAALTGTPSLVGVPAAEVAGAVALNGTAAGAFASASIGTTKAVTVSGLTLGGTAPGNYSLSLPTNLTADINPKLLTASFTAKSKTYDGNTAAEILTRSVSGKVGNEDVSLAGGTATFADKTAADNKTVTGAGFTLSGAQASNYALQATPLATTTADIKALSLTAHIVASNKVYDGNTEASLTGRSVSGQLQGDDVSLSNLGTATFASKAAGQSKTVTATGLTLSGNDAGNYSLDGSATTAADITPKPLVATVTALNKEYNGTTTALINGLSLSGIVESDAVSFTINALNFSDKNVGSGKTVTASGLELAGTDKGNYSLTSTSASTTADITAKALTIAITADNKTYDGSTSATTHASIESGLVDNDVVTVSAGGGSFEDKNVGTNKVVTANVSKAGADAGNYTANATATTKANITAAELTASFTAQSKVYDGTAQAVILNKALNGVLEGDNVTLEGGIANFNTKDVGTSKMVTVSSFTLDGAQAGNYSLSATNPTATANITAATLTYTANSATRMYGEANGSLSGTVTGFVNNETAATATTGTASFTSVADAASPVGRYGVTGAGLAAKYGNYTFAQASDNSTALEVSARPITITANLGQTKVYGDNEPEAFTYAVSGSGLASVDAFTGALSRAIGNTVGAYTIGQGSLSIRSKSTSASTIDNYSLTYVPNDFTITPKAVTVTPAAGQGKTYGSVEPVLAYEPVTLVGNDAFTGSLSRVQGNTVGTYNITQGSLGLSNNYTLNFTPQVKFTITAKALTASIAANDKVYDGGLVATATGSVLPAEVVSGDEVRVDVTNPVFATKQVGADKTVTATVALSGASAPNYRLSANIATAQADITAKPLTASVTINNKVYDGGTAAIIATRTLDGVVPSDVVSLTGGTATFTDKNVQNTKTVTITGLSLTGADESNYSVSATTTATADITPRPLEVTATAGQSKVYGTTTDPVLAYTITSGTKVSGDNFSGQLLRAEGELVNTYAISLGSLTLGNNYSLSLASGSSFAITRKALTASIVAQNKVYDATVDATATGSVLAADLVGNDIVTITVTDAQFNDKRVGNTKPVMATVALGGGATGNYSLTSNTAATTANITAAELVPSFTAASRVYNGDLATRITGRSIDGVLLTDQVFLSAGTASFVDKNVGEAKTVTGTGFSLTGTDAGNYRLPATNPTTKADITPKAMTIAISATNKPYDGNRDAAVTASIESGLVSNDAVTVSAGNGLFDTKNVGTGKTVTAAVSKAGADAGNYTANTTATTTAAISSKALSIAIAAQDKVYDGNRNAAVTASIASGLVDDDVVTVSATEALFADKHVGTTKTVNSNVSKAGADADNYTANTTATTTAAISAKPLVISITATDKVYNGNTAAITSALLASTSGLVMNDVVTVSSRGGNFNDKNVASGKTVTAAVSKAGADAGNYTANSTATATAAITPKAITPVFTAQSKTYDGNTNATILTRSLAGQLPDDDVTLTGGSATFDTKDVGANKTVTANGLALSGADRGNYSASATATTTAAITAKQLTATIVAQNKTYNGSPAATATGSVPDADLIDGEAVGVTVSYAAFNNKNVGGGKTVTATVALSGTASSNYSLTSTSASTTAAITPKALEIVITADNKTYNGNADATAHATIGSGLVQGDAVLVEATHGAFDNKSVGNGKPVWADVSIAGGADKGNYSANATASTSANITPLAVVGHFTAENKIYNASTAAAVLTRTLTGVIGQDAVALAGGTATFADKNVGVDKIVTLADATLDGADKGNYSLSSVATATATIARLDITGSFVASNKVYDGNTVATVISRTPNGVLGTDAVTLISGTAAFNTKDVASGKTVAASGMTLGGAQAGNYNLTSVGSTTADITPRPIQVTATAGQSKVYGTVADPQLAYTIATGSKVAEDSFSGQLVRADGEQVKTYAISLGTLSLGTNYDLSLAPGATFAITAKPLVPAVLANNKVYNNNTTAAISSRTLTGIVGQDDVTLTGGTAAFGDKNAGTGKTVTATGLALSGNMSGNYSLTTTTATTTADITALGITGSFTANSRVYNGTVGSTIATRSLNNVFAGDAVTLAGGTATYADANVGTGKPVTGTGFSLAGAQAGNYSLMSVASTSADITPLGITPSFTAASRMYDGTTTATILTRSLTGVLTADVPNVTLTGGTATFSDENVGVDKVVTATGFTLAGTAASNYSLTTTSATTKATITQQTANPVADTYYTGSSFFWTTGSSSSTATLNLVATIRNNPNFTGDIRTAKASFFVRNGTTLVPINGAQNLPVGLVNPGDLTVGTAAASVQYSISSSAAILNIAVVVTGNYKSIDNSTLDKEVMVAAPTPGGLIAGGGKFDATGTAGYIKGSSSFAFYVQYNKSLKNPQGGAEITVNSYYDRNGKETPGVLHTYKLKSNAISTLATTNPTAQFSSKANIAEIVGGVAQSIEGNCTMQLDLFDGIDNPAATEKVDRLAITVYRSSGGVWFSNNWNGTQTLRRDLGAGDVVTVTGSGTNTTTLATTSSSKPMVLSGPTPTAVPESGLLEVYPNPMTEQGTIHFRMVLGGKAQVYLYNSAGGLVSTLFNAEVEGGRAYDVKVNGSELPNGVYFCRMIMNGKVENKRITIAH
ncbi:T9SS type A sorting domain-containing protein [Hymenobacter taeanensis]|uniref:T9SS type A sorting domain-containing protein n=1 Tax=Hymenobacter taeanensis TaxID=2735321 RepID=A0A6M6BJH6_9BACT|nr:MULTISPECIES: YDG domain-containing protein [Hymenobacter]QJX48210.1 T9SS type A sorting domain-containing protein [Hymenobacter taeanensis]UOQ82313.1 YDG domain-containing protein [Hymenobacter sp. 5414T-23]